MVEKRIDIIIVNYNGFLYTQECVNSLLKINYSNYRIVIVDNYSTDNSYTLLVSAYGRCGNIDIIRTPDNLGFAGGNNFGIKYAISKGAEFFLLLNNDTEVDPEFLNKMVCRIDDLTIISPIIYYYDYPSDVWYGAGHFNRMKCISENGDYTKESFVNFATGCCELIPKSVIDKVGFMAEEYFMYYEDADYSLRAISNGIRILFTPEAKVYHKVGKSSGGEQSKFSIYYNNRNRLYLIKSHHFGIICSIYTYVTRIIRLLLSILKNNNDYIILRAYSDYKKGKMGKQMI
ncbi:glycosyltransferase family 2 protein [Bullifex porci]|uniref:glycosyltransferase family 2 protein n=1 Tax=Bullifex porci TaxID=2606638 RepID=UPI0023F12400|nr:glycosyltransferase family 2 protein [Bullifex porci]MDD7255908.1 glycosyltransferase family 2 protein [Bullifex porci]